MMAGRGRGRRILGFSVDPVGRGEPGPPTAQQPTPVFPVMEQKPLPLTGGEEAEYLLALKQDLRGSMRTRPGFLQPAPPPTDVERYSDKYHSADQTDVLTDWAPDWKRFPRELRVHQEPRERVCVSLSLSDGGGCVQKRKRRRKVGEKEEVLLKLETLQRKEEEEEEEEEKKKKQEEEEEAEEEYDEEEFEEETDYIMSYVSDGDDFGGDSDDNMDEAVY